METHSGWPLSPWPLSSRPDAARKRSRSAAGEPEPLDLMLDFFVNPDHAGIYTALENGHFEEAGLDVKTRVPSDPLRRSSWSPPARRTSR